MGTPSYKTNSDIIGSLIEIAEIRRAQWRAVTAREISECFDELHEASYGEAGDMVAYLNHLIQNAKKLATQLKSQE